MNQPTSRMTTISKEIISVKTDQDAVFLRNRVTEYAVRIRMGLVNQTKLLTAASELVRNMLRYGGGGKVICEVVSQSVLQTGIRLTFTDKGPGIPNVDAAMKDGFSTGKSLGLGLPGARRLVSEFSIKSAVGEGTSVTILKWKNG
ncbi:MAG TPA: anti-sigma regulatory factor [Puia sp.]|nr:anti-sigma regulatory factor [Puia sp.]